MEGCRPATRDDTEALLRLWALAVEELSGQRGGPALLRQLGLERPARDAIEQALHAAASSGSGRLLLVGTLDEEVVAAGWVVTEAFGDGHRLARLQALYVEPPARGVGVGAQLMTTVLAWCAEQGCDGLDGHALPGDRHTKGFFEGHHLTARLLTMHRSLS